MDKKQKYMTSNMNSYIRFKPMTEDFKFCFVFYLNRAYPD